MSNKRKPQMRNPFPTTTPMSRYEVAEIMGKFGRHDAIVVEGEAHIFAVECSCGYRAGAPFGVEMAIRILENHLSRYGLAPDPMGAKYRV
jgi:hypothetical protein